MSESSPHRRIKKTGGRPTNGRSTSEKMALAGRSRAFKARKGGRRSILSIALFFTLLFIMLFVVGAGVSVYAYVSQRLPSTEIAAERMTFQSTFIYDRNGKFLYEVLDPDGGRRMVVQIEDICPNLINATIATEDATFYSNPGVDLRALVRALWQNATSGEIESGFSTITMQVVRNVLLTEDERYERTVLRKMKESILAYQLSQQYTKNQILEIYLNEINYGNTYYGIEAAAQSYFGKSAKDLTLAEAALLAGLPQSPGDYNPLQYPDMAKKRQEYVLAAMVKHGYITAQQEEAAKAEKLTYQTPKYEINAPHFSLYVRDQLVKMFGADEVYQRGLRVTTTLDLDMQSMGEKAVRDHIATIKNLNANDAALVAIDPKNGEILAMVGSVDYNDESIQGQINMATSPRQPGSALKPFAYATAFEKGIMTPDTIIIDQPTTFPGIDGSPPYTPHNHDYQWHGAVTLRQALACSLNIPAVLTLQRIGIASFLDTIHNMGITTLNGSSSLYGLSIVLGGAEVPLVDATFAYAPFANKGVQVGSKVSLSERTPGSREYEPVSILKVTDSSGEVLYEYHPPAGKQVIKEGTAYLITSVLSDDKAREGTYGLHSFLELSRPSAAKTGTTDYYQDGWTIGYTPDLVTGVWVGNADDSAMTGVYGVSGAGYIWHNFMEAALKDKPVTEFSSPSNIVQVEVCTETGLLPSSTCKTHKVTLPADLVPKQVCPGHATPTAEPRITPTITTKTPQTRTTATPQLQQGKVIVPNVVGLSEENARKQIEAAKLNNSFTNWQTINDVEDKSYFNSVSVGTVLSQQPAAGTQVNPGTTVYIAVRKE